MRRRTTGRSAWAVVLLAIGLVGGVRPVIAQAPAQRPNVLIVMTDDQGYGDFSCHGNPVLKTPNLDRLAAQSIRFTDFHVAPMCTPTRGQLMTGRDAVHNGATSVTAGRSFARPGIPMMPEIFAASGYRTGLFGKWHLGDNYPHRPMDKGFQEAVYHLGWGITSAPEFANTLFDGRYFRNGAPQRFTGHCTDLWFQQAMRWMRERKEKAEPFFCYLPTNAPHGPSADAEEFVKPYRGRGPAEFFGMIAHVDHCVGQLERFLRETGLRDNTIVIFMTDNGGTAGVKTFNAGMRAGKTTYYDGGHRVPCWVRWPDGGLRAPGEVDAPTQNQDLLPTLIEFCGLSRPQRDDFDGVSLAGLLRGAATSLPDRMLIVQYGQQIEKWACCVIWNQWRLVHGAELYDIRKDPAQQHDRSAEQPEVVSRMRRHYERWWSGVEPRLNDFVATSIGSERQPLTSLTSSDWENVYCDNSRHIRGAAGGPRGGHWNVLVEQAGSYEVALRRWPRETGLALGAASGEDSRAFPIAAAVVEIAGRKLTARAASTEQEVVLRVSLPAGEAELQAWFQDAQGNDLCGAFYCYVRR